MRAGLRILSIAPIRASAEEPRGTFSVAVAGKPSDLHVRQESFKKSVSVKVGWNVEEEEWESVKRKGTAEYK